MIFSYSHYPTSIHNIFSISDFLRDFRIRIVASDLETQEIAEWILNNSSEIIINLETPNDLFDKGVVRNQVEVMKLSRKLVFSGDPNEIKKIRSILSNFFFEKIKEYNLNKFRIEIINPFLLRIVKEKIEKNESDRYEIIQEYSYRHLIETHIFREDPNHPFGYDVDSYLTFRMYFDQESEKDSDRIVELLEEFYDYAKFLLLLSI